MKKTLSIILSICMLLSITAGLNLSAYADTLTTGKCGDNVTYSFNSSNGTLTINGTGNTDTYDAAYIETSRGCSPFYDNSDIKNVVINNGVTGLSCGLFYSCDYIKSVSLPDSLKTIDTDVFYGLIESINIPKNVNSISSDMCRGCKYLSNISVSSDNQSYCSVDGILFSKNKSKIVIYPINKNSSTYSIPESVTEICDYAFQGNDNLTKIIISKNVLKIGRDAFAGCRNLSNIELLCSSDISIGEWAFEYTDYYYESSNWSNYGLYLGTHLLYVDSDASGIFVVKNGTTTIAEHAIWYDEDITSVLLPDTLLRIGECAFLGSENLKSLSIPESVEYIGWRAFPDATKNVYYSSTKSNWKKISIVYNVDEWSDNWLIANGVTVHCSDGTIKYGNSSSSSSSSSTSTTSSKISIKKCKITANNKTYTGKNINQNPKVTYNGKTLKKGTDYTLSFKNNKKVGTATITIKGKGKYTGSTTKKFKICKKLAPKATSLDEIQTSTSVLSIWYKGQSKDVTGYNVQVATKKKFSKKSIVADLTVKGKSTHCALAKNLSSNVLYYVRVRTYGYNGAENFYSKWSKTGSAVTKLNKPTGLKVTNDTKKPSPNTLKLSWSKSSGAQGYEIYRSTKKKGKYALIKTIKKGSTVSYTDTKLNDLTKYYYKVKAISKKDKKANSGYSSAVGCKTLRPMSKVSVAVAKAEYNYNSPLTPSVVAIYSLGGKIKKDTDYTVSYSNNTKAGKNIATVTLTGKGNYYGSKSFKFTISPKSLPDSDITVSGCFERNGQYYPSTVKIKSKNITLKENTDFTFGTPTKTDDSHAKVTITFKGNYTGSVTKTYETYTYQQAYKRFISNERWKNGISWGNSKQPEIAGFGQSCAAYCADFIKFIYNKDSWGNNKYSSAQEIKAGDIIHYNNGTGIEAGHWFVVLERNGNTLYTAEGNFLETVRITKTGYEIKGDNVYSNATDKEYSLYYGYHNDFTGFYYKF